MTMQQLFKRAEQLLRERAQDSRYHAKDEPIVALCGSVAERVTPFSSDHLIELAAQDHSLLARPSVEFDPKDGFEFIRANVSSRIRNHLYDYADLIELHKVSANFN